MKHQYEIRFNRGSSIETAVYGYGNTKEIRLSVGKQNASIRFAMSEKKKVQDLTSFSVKLVRDAFRKVYLIHALQNNEGLHISRITVGIDGEETVFGPDSPNFPFLFSMIEKKPLGLGTAWKNVAKAVTLLPKSAMDEDLCFAAVFSYLQSKCKPYAIDQFTNLWTAMNALYNWIASQYEQGLKVKYNLPEDAKLHKNLKLLGDDSDSIGALAWLICPQYEKLSREEKGKLWLHFYDTEKLLSGYSTQDIQQLYDDAIRCADGEPIPEKWQPINRCAQRFSLPLFTYLLLIYPYHWRCNFFHGNRTTMLFAAYNDYEIGVLHVINYFIDRFLNEEIPKLFEKGYWTETKQEAVETLLRKIRSKEYEKALNKTLTQVNSHQ